MVDADQTVTAARLTNLNQQFVCVGIQGEKKIENEIRSLDLG